MRPVDKWDPTLMLIPEEYNPYQDAKPYLCANLDYMCSYCEKTFKDERDLHVEHIQPKRYIDSTGKAIYANLISKWSNFLLACATCNGTDNKGCKNIVYGTCHLPHLNNTFLSLEYKTGGVVRVNPALKGVSATNAQALLELVGLQKTPTTSSPKDNRWRIRLEVWNKSMRYRQKYEEGKVDIDTIIDLVRGYGCWSIWFTVFVGCDEVRKALITSFRGTSASCFDSNNHYEPVLRNPGANDPV